MSAATKKKYVFQQVEDYILPEHNQFVAEVGMSRGNNLHEVMARQRDDKNENGVVSFLASMPSRFRKTVWIKRGDFVLCEWIPEGDKVQAEIMAPLSRENIKYIKKQGLWPFECSEKHLSNTGEVDGDLLPPSCSSGSDNDTDELEEIARSAKYSREQLEEWLRQNGFTYTTVEHEEVKTVEAALKHFEDVSGVFVKNLFLKAKKTNQLFLLCTRHDAKVNLGAIGKALGLGSGTLRFGPESELFENLGVEQGCVSILALLNDENHVVTLLLDKFFVEQPKDMFYFHPMVNSASLGILGCDVLRFLKLINCEYKVVDLDASSIVD